KTERPIPGARVLTFGPGGRQGGYADADGIVEFCVPPGQFRCLFLSPPGDLAVLGDGGRPEEVRRVVSGEAEELTLYAPGPLGRLLAMKAALRCADGSPASRIEVHHASRLAYGTARGRHPATTEDDGRFELEGLAATDGQEVFLYATTDDRRFVLAELLALEDDAPAMPETLVMQAARSTGITITDEDGEPRAGMALKLLPRAWDETLFTAPHLSFATDESGAAIVEGLVPGLEYLLIEEKAHFSEHWWDFLHTEVVLLDESVAPDVERLPRRTVVLSDTLFVGVVDAAGAPIPIEGIQSLFVVGDDGMRHTTGRVEAVERRQDGSVTIPATSVSGKPGQAMEIVVVPAGRPRAIEANGVLPERPWRRLEFVAEASPVETEVDLSRGPRDVAEGDVAGCLVDPKGAPVAGARVLLFPRKALSEGPRPEWPVAISDADGVFRIPGLGDAWYTYAEIQAKGFATTWITDLPVGKGFAVTLDSATRVRATFELPDGSPAGAASVSFTKDKPTPRVELGRKVRGLRLDTRTDARGVLDLPIEPGVYEVVV
ncbi:MAG: carboxypeptidase-like regulatory domain-containing protein, partial [Actinobacteria bacterium]|nr:carboxypeptidase-like regulatory domain-containing protein [Actinomycetota bacterium]